MTEKGIDYAAIAEQFGLKDFGEAEALGFIRSAVAINLSPIEVANLFLSTDNEVLHQVANSLFPNGIEEES